MAAAVASARSGAATVLLESHGCLGGVWTAGQVAWVIDSSNKSGLMQEFTEDLFRMGAARRRVANGRNYGFDVENMKLLLEAKCLDAGVRLLLHARVAAAQRRGRTIRHAISESKSGRQAWSGKVHIDATGDGDLGALAGCGFDVGHPETGRVQPIACVPW